MKKFFASSISAIIILSCAISPSAHATEISEDTAGLISVTCGSIQLQLKNVQKADSKMRVFLGSKYEFILTKLMTNLNLRLVKNNLVTDNLASSQTTFSSEFIFFKASFTDYSKSLDALIATDCKSNPYGFYEKLESTREKREAVRASYLRLKDVLALHRESVIELKGEL